jgi:uncharacterized protein (TIGR03083 family)
MGEIGTLYAAGRQRITELVADLDDAEAKAPVPTCPAWTVADVLAHLAGTCTDILNGNIEGVATDPWTHAQVEARRGRPFADLLAEWSEAAPQVEAFAKHFPGRVGDQWILDLTSHEHDVRAALGRPGARDTEHVQRSYDFMAGGLAASIAARKLPPLELRTDGGTSVVVGGGTPFDGTVADALQAAVLGGADFTGGEPGGTVQASAFELLRALTGRRSLDQVRAYEWSTDPEPWFEAFTFGPFSPSPTPVEE